MASFESESSRKLDNGISTVTIDNSNDTEVTAHLTINTMILLGFDTDSYIHNYSGIAFDVRPLTINSFQKSNEKMLMVSLHFLLLTVDKEEFTSSIEKCFPYLDSKEKNQFKRAVHNSIGRVLEEHPTTAPTYKASILTQAMGTEVWSLLRFLSDIALDITLCELKGQEYNHAPTTTSATPITPTTTPGNDKVDQKRVIGGPSWATASYKNTLKSTNSMYLNPDGTTCDVGNSALENELASILTESDANAAANALRHELLYEIDEKVAQVKNMLLQATQEKVQWAQYLQELEVRLYNARKLIKESEAKLAEYRAADHFKLLTEEGTAKRQRLLGRITTQKDLLQAFLDSPLLLTIHKHLEEEKAHQEASRLQTSGDHSIAPPALSAPRRRRVLSSEEMEAYKTSMRDAIGHLIKKIEEVCSVV